MYNFLSDTTLKPWHITTKFLLLIEKHVGLFLILENMSFVGRSTSLSTSRKVYKILFILYEGGITFHKAVP